MRSYTFRISFLAAVCFASCAPSEVKHDLPIPDKIEVKKSPEHVQISGTRIFIIPPQGSKQDSVSHKLFIDKFTDIYFLEYTIKGFSMVREEQIGKFLLLKEKYPDSKGLLFYKYFLLGKDSAAVAYGIDPETKAGKITWLVGGSDYAISAVGTFPANQRGTRDEILAALQSIYIDTMAYVDYAAASHYTIDTTKTDFKHHIRQKDVVYYTSVKAGGIGHNFASITTVPLPLIADIDYEVAVRTYLQNSERVHKLKPLMVDTRKITINGLKAIQCSYQILTPNGNWQCLIMFISDGQRSIILTGSVPLGENELFATMKEFAGTIRMM